MAINIIYTFIFLFFLVVIHNMYLLLKSLKEKKKLQNTKPDISDYIPLELKLKAINTNIRYYNQVIILFTVGMLLLYLITKYYTSCPLL